MLDKNVYIDAANDYRALDALSDELARIDPSQTEYFIKCIFRLLKLHRAFYQKATLILLDIEDGEQQAYISLFKRDAREEQKRLIGILRSFETQETLIERLTRRSKAANMAGFIQQCFNDIFSDWGIPQGSNMLVYDPE